MNRPHITTGALYSVVVLFVITCTLAAGNLFFTSSEVARLQGTRASVVQLCQAGNDARAQQVTLWTHLVAISAPPAHQTAAQAARRRAVIAAFLRFVRQVFAPRDCSAKFSQ